MNTKMHVFDKLWEVYMLGSILNHEVEVCFPQEMDSTQCNSHVFHNHQADWDSDLQPRCLSQSSLLLLTLWT